MDEVLPSFPGDLSFTGKDRHDYHVHAGAVAGRADVLLTVNAATDITTQPEAEPYDILAPDEFFTLVVASNSSCLLPITREQLAYWAPREDHCQLDDALRRAGCPRFAERVRLALSQIARGR